ncbi:MAG: dehydrogenase-like protein [Phycisphaerales bacterium]|nr:dehydrogenase-like protein [Phycisphaerales bacterium]
MPKRVTNVVVIGAGFAGLHCCRGLRNVPVNIALFDRNNYHLFQPLLYQVATAALSPADIAFPIRSIFSGQKNVDCVLSEVTSIDLAKNCINAGDLCIDYDYLVVAAGATHSYFGRDEWEKFAPGLKRVEDAIEIRKRILLAYEEAEHEEDESERRAKLTFVVVGGGPTGVELAGALREIAVEQIQKDYRNIDTSTARVILVEANDRVLKNMHPKLSEKAKEALAKMGVEIRLSGRVTQIDDGGVCVGTERIGANNVFWAAGVKANPLGKSLGVPLDRAGRVDVNADLSIPGYPNAFVIGDLCSIVDKKTNAPVPGLAPAAMQMGDHVAKIIRQEVTGNVKVENRIPFAYWDKGTMATIGKAKAVADIQGWKFSGFIAWCMWSGIHLLFLIGFRSKVIVLINWLWNYWFDSKGARLITGDFKPRITRMRDVTPAEEPYAV